MKTIKEKNLVSFLATGLLSTVLIGGMSASADELITEVQSLDVDTLSSEVFDIYQLDSFYLSTVDTISFTNYSTSKLSFEEYLVENIKSFNTTIDISSYSISKTNSDVIKETLNKIRLTHPEFFCLGSNFSVGYYGNTIKLLRLEYTCTQEEYAQQLATVDNKFNEILSKLDNSMSDKEKALVVHDYLCTNFYYDHTASIFDMYNFVTEGSGVCQSYMLAYNYILNKLNIESFPVISDDINHTWNMANLDGEYYQIDVTWDDYSYQLLGWANHNYFMLTDSEMSSTHGNSWYIYDYDDVSATDTTYQMCKFKSSHSPCVVIDSELFYIDNGLLCEYNFNEDSLTPISDLVSKNSWINFTQSTTNSKMIYSTKYSSLNPYKDVIFYNTPNKIVAIDTSGNTLDDVYTYSSNTDAIYGINIQDGYLIAQFEPDLDSTRNDFATNIQTICNVEEWYQEYLGSSDTVTEVTTTITTTSNLTTTETTTTVTTPNVTTTENTTITTTPKVTTTETITTVTTPNVATDSESSVESTSNVEDTYYNLDVNSDSYVNSKDLLELKSHLVGKSSKDFIFDINGDGFANILDLLILKSRLLNG